MNGAVSIAGSLRRIAAVTAAFCSFDLSAQPIFADGFEQRVAPAATAWHQHAADPARRSYVAAAVPLPWRWKWAFNGPAANGAIAPGKSSLPRNVQPVTGGGRVYVAAGARGLFALSAADGQVLWNRLFAGEVLATPAYQPGAEVLFVASAEGRLHRLSASSGATLHSVALAGPARTAPLLLSDRVLVAAGTVLHAFRASDLQPLWSHDAGSLIETPPAASAEGRIIFATADLFVRAVALDTGLPLWQSKPTPRQPAAHPEGLPFGANEASYRFAWPVVADASGLVLIKLRLDWQTMWDYGPQTSNASIRAFFATNPGQQALHALRLSDGSPAFIANIGHGGYGNGDYMPMGPQPVIRTLGDGSQIAYAIVRGRHDLDPRWDSFFGELMLDGSVPGFAPGDIRWIAYPGLVDYLLTDEQPNLSMAGDQLFGGHWMAGYAIRPLERSPAYGTYANPIPAEPLPHIVTSSNSGSFSQSHWSPGPLAQDGDARLFPFGFYIYWNQGPVYDAYWSEYAVWVVSEGLVLFRSCDGAIVALEHGAPTAAALGKAAGAAPPQPLEAPAPIPAERARAFAGAMATVEGQIAKVFNNGKAIQLYFAWPHKGHFKALIEREHWPAFGAGLGTARGYEKAKLFRDGQRVRVRGTIGWYQGDPAIRITHPQAIEVLKR